MALKSTLLNISFAMRFDVIVILATSPRHKSDGKECSATITITPKGKAMDTTMFKH